MDVVALTELATTEEIEAPHLAVDIDVSVYEARQKLVVGLPTVVLMTPSRARALEVLAKLRARGHGAVAFAASDVVPAASMVPIRKFRLDDKALVIEPVAQGAVELEVPYDEMTGLVRAVHRRSFETRDDVKERKLRPLAAIASGGVILTKTVKREVVSVSEERQQALYLFRRGGVPCLLLENGAQYAGLGALVKPTRLENFVTTVQLLRQRAPRVVYDARLVTLRKTPAPPTEPSSPRAFDPINGGIDLLAHILVTSVPPASVGPFRG